MMLETAVSSNEDGALLRDSAGSTPAPAIPGVSVSVLVAYPGIGSVWLNDAEWTADSVEGWAWDSSEVGSPYLPDDFHGQPEQMNFPLTCVLKVRGELPTPKAEAQ